MSVQALSWVLNKSKSSLGSRLVMLSIANHADADGMNSWPSITVIARESRVSQRQAQRCINSLEKLGELEIERGAGYKGSHRFRIVGMG
jgi:Helix-turn-helix domain